MKVIWSSYAKYSFADELEFIYKKWNSKEVNKFITLVDIATEKLSSETLQGKSPLKHR